MFLLILTAWATETSAQLGESPIRIFGYFQNSFHHWPQAEATTTHPQFVNPQTQSARNSFNMQQLNLFLSTNLSRHWRAFVNFEFLNSYSTSRQWGATNVEEAWVRYKASDQFSVKFGLLIPAFNNLNEIKNRSPLLPYIIRPLIYETSFSEFLIAVEEGAPARANLQISGVIPSGKANLDYAVYLGNSPNINDDSNRGQTGVDTTNTFMAGGRLGIRLKDFKAGVSMTREKINFRMVNIGAARYDFIYDEVPRTRLGCDLSFNLDRLSFEGEYTVVKYGDISEIKIDGEVRDDTSGDTDFEGDFYYGTLGYRITPQIFSYASYWYLKHTVTFIASEMPSLITAVGVESIAGPSFGISYKLSDRITFKGQYVTVNIKDEFPLALIRQTIVTEQRFDIFTIAASVFF